MAIGSNNFGWVFLKTTFCIYDENNTPTTQKGEIGVRKKQYTFQKRKECVGHFDQLVSRVEKLIS